MLDILGEGRGGWRDRSSRSEQTEGEFVDVGGDRTRRTEPRERGLPAAQDSDGDLTLPTKKWKCQLRGKQGGLQPRVSGARAGSRVTQVRVQWKGCQAPQNS